MNARKRRKYIFSLKRPDDSLTWNNEEKEGIIYDYFSGIMGNKVPRTRTFNWDRLALTTVQVTSGLELDRPFTESEIEAAVMSLPGGKAPGPDGFSAEFYKHCWSII